ncbi:MAG: transketolase [Dehalococcoidia bacterium]|nr:transketolase [Dehalococcoidia bacterium]
MAKAMASAPVSGTAPESPSSARLKGLTLEEMKAMARKLRRHVITMLGAAGSGHPGGSLSAAEILTVLYFKEMRYNAADPNWPERDRFVLSKGHAAPILYAALAESGYFPVEELSTLRKLGSRLQGHADRTLTPGVEMSSGSLGQGLSFSIGVALAARLDSRPYRIYVLLGDGECQEGQVWEAAMAAAHFKLDNVVAFVDHNGLQLDGRTRDIMNIEPLSDKWRAFGWHVFEVDGHDLAELSKALEKARGVKVQPSVIIAHTVKGKGVSFMENNVEYHGKVPSGEDLERALKELA